MFPWSLVGKLLSRPNQQCCVPGTERRSLSCYLASPIIRGANNGNHKKSTISKSSFSLDRRS